ncbi:MAG: radical SAM protein [Candidatus Bathyarchaeia archaeon]|jgi:uncharacterized protein
MLNLPAKIKEMTVWVTGECNLSCKYCFVYKLNQNPPHGKMTMQTADQLIRFCTQNLDPNGALWFFGAEPFCNFDTLKYIVEKSHTDGHKWNFGVTTNCTLVTEDIALWMKKYNFGATVSIDGSKNSHDTNRVYPNGKGSWEDAWRGFLLLKKHFTNTPQLRWTVTPSTVKGLADAIKSFVEEFNLTSLAVDMVYEAEWAPQDLANLRQELEIFRGYYKNWMERGVPVFSMWVRDANAAITQTRRVWDSRCGLGQGGISVDYDGSIYPCHRFVDSHEIKIGDIYSGFAQSRLDWIKHWQNIAPYCEVPTKCLSCNYKNNCIGGCIAQNYDVFGLPHVNPETFCTIKQLITDVFSELCKSMQTNKTFQKLYAKPPFEQKPKLPQTSTNSTQLAQKN